jgi:branched-chain amino acid transport system substrate-binding protein
MRARANGVVIALVATLVLAAAGCGDDDDGGSSGESSDKGPILIGISAAKTGLYQPYDLQSGQLLQMRLEEINAEGGVLGRRFKTQWIDTKSDKPAAGTNALELIANGAKFIIGTCDFDYSFPAMQAAATKNVPAMALCASSPKSATPAIVGDLSGTMGLGSDSEGVAMAEWLRENRPELKRAYVFKDTAIQYSQATADYFEARWKELGGEVCGKDDFVGGPTLDLSSQITRLRGQVGGCDVIYDSSFIPFSAQLVRSVRDAGVQLPIAGNAGLNGSAVREVAGPISEVYVLGFECVPTYCSGGGEAVSEVNDKFEAKYGKPIADSYALPGYDLGTAIAAAIEKADSTDGEKVAAALFDSGVTVKTLIGEDASFTAECHRPQPATYSVEQFTDGKSKQVGKVTVQGVPEIGDKNPCR